MFAFTAVPAPWGTLCQLLLIGVAVLLIGGFAFNRYNTERLGRMPKLTELPQSVLLIALAVIVWLTAAQGTSLATLGLLVAIGMALGFIGDLFMANVFKQENHVLFGMLAFAAGHVFYMLGFREIAVHFGLHDLGAYALALVLTWGIALVLWFTLIRKPGGDVMQYAALGYALFLASMAGFALGLAFQQGAFLPLAVGALSFLLSDALIAARIFADRRFAYMGDVIWATYILAQALIVTAVPVALAL